MAYVCRNKCNEKTPSNWPSPAQNGWGESRGYSNQEWSVTRSFFNLMSTKTWVDKEYYSRSWFCIMPCLTPLPKPIEVVYTWNGLHAVSHVQRPHAFPIRLATFCPCSVRCGCDIGDVYAVVMFATTWVHFILILDYLSCASNGLWQRNLKKYNMHKMTKW